MDETFQNNLRYQINRFIFDHGFAPNVDELATLTKTDTSVVVSALQALADHHALVLHPGTLNIWVAHPFALFPTLFWVTAGDKKWWSSCIWCSLGIAALTGMDTLIYTKLEGTKDPLVMEVRDGLITDENYVVHFPMPVKRIWDNVIHFCANTLLFKTSGDVDTWCARHRVEKGQALPVAQVWELAKRWYGYYLSPDWQPKTPEFAAEIFERVGLTGDFWKVV